MGVGGGRGPPRAHARRGGGARWGDATARARLGADILRIAPPGIPRCPGSDSSSPRAAAPKGGGGTRRGKVRPGTGSSHPQPRSSRSALVRVVPHPAGFCLCLHSLWGRLSVPLTRCLPGTPAVPPPRHPYFLDEDTTCGLFSISSSTVGGLLPTPPPQ